MKNRLHMIAGIVIVAACITSSARSERITYNISGTSSSRLGFINSSRSNPIRGTVDIIFDESSGSISFENERAFVGTWNGDELDFSSPRALSLHTLTGQVQDDHTVFFRETPEGFYPPWEREPREDGFFTVYFPVFRGTAIEGRFSPDRQSMEFVRASDYTIADGGRSILILDLHAVPEPCGNMLAIGAMIVLAVRVRR